MRLNTCLACLVAVASNALAVPALHAEVGLHVDDIEESLPRKLMRRDAELQQVLVYPESLSLTELINETKKANITTATMVVNSTDETPDGDSAVAVAPLDPKSNRLTGFFEFLAKSGTLFVDSYEHQRAVTCALAKAGNTSCSNVLCAFSLGGLTKAAEDVDSGHLSALLSLQDKGSVHRMKSRSPSDPSPDGSNNIVTVDKVYVNFTIIEDSPAKIPLIDNKLRYCNPVMLTEDIYGFMKEQQLDLANKITILHISVNKSYEKSHKDDTDGLLPHIESETDDAHAPPGPGEPPHNDRMDQISSNNKNNDAQLNTTGDTSVGSADAKVSSDANDTANNTDNATAIKIDIE